jgi:hypothetical protein
MIYVSNNTLKTIGQCTTEDVLRYGLRLTAQEERAELLAGSAAHKALAQHLRGRSLRVAMAAFAAEYEAFARREVPSTDRLAYDNAYAIVERWVKKNPVDRLPWRVEQVEIKFNFPIAEGVNYMGIIDALVRARSGGPLEPLEHKTTGSNISGERWPRQFRFEAQLTGSAWAAEQATGEPVRAVWVNAIEFRTLPSSDRRCSTHAVRYAECGVLHANWRILGPLSRPRSQIESWRRDVVKLAKRHARNLERYSTLEAVQQSAPMEGRFTGKCTYCTFFKFCAAGRQPRHAKSMLLEMEPREIFNEGMQFKEAAAK